MLTADLHFHTTCSDGKHSVDFILKTLEAARSKAELGFAALTDHDGVEGFEVFSEGVKKWWKPLCASELSCTYESKEAGKNIELHLLMYGINPKDPGIQSRFERFKEERRLRFFRICERVKQAGYSIDAEAIAKSHPGVLGRPHVADALVKAGIVSTRSEAFDRFLGEGKPFDVKKWRFPLEDAVALCKSKWL
jgi:predicted metal-dependent phosphoesterase TrpH